MYKPALLYYSAVKAKTMSFVELFEHLEKYQSCRRERWDIVARVKRGLTDTSQYGGLCKDAYQFLGAVELLKNRRKIEFSQLFLSKISYQDV